MAKKQTSNLKPTAVVCHKCGKVIPPDDEGRVTDYVWRDGFNYCKECNNVKPNYAVPFQGY